MTIFASWYCTMKPLTTSGKGSVSVAGKHPLFETLPLSELDTLIHKWLSICADTTRMVY